MAKETLELIGGPRDGETIGEAIRNLTARVAEAEALRREVEETRHVLAHALLELGRPLHLNDRALIETDWSTIVLESWRDEGAQETVVRARRVEAGTPERGQ